MMAAAAGGGGQLWFLCAHSLCLYAASTHSSDRGLITCHKHNRLSTRFFFLLKMTWAICASMGPMWIPAQNEWIDNESSTEMSVALYSKLATHMCVCCIHGPTLNLVQRPFSQMLCWHETVRGVRHFYSTVRLFCVFRFCIKEAY